MEIGDVIFKQANPEEQVIEMLVSEFEGMEKYEKKKPIKIDQQEPDEEGE
jgi:hypothetical protein